MTNADHVVSRQQIMEEVWQTTYLGDTRTLDVHIRWIRQAVEQVPNKPKRVDGAALVYKQGDERARSVRDLRPTISVQPARTSEETIPRKWF